MSDDYLKRFILLGAKFGVTKEYIDRVGLVKILHNYLISNNISIVEPNDMSVFYNVTDYNQKSSFRRAVVTYYYSIRHTIKNVFLK